MFPSWLHVLSIAVLLLALVCAVVAGIDVVRRPQPMAIMNIVWPVACLFGGPLTLWFYFVHGRTNPAQQKRKNPTKPALPIIVAKGALHCGSGCMLGDITAEWLAFLVPGVAMWVGWHWLFADKTYAVWVLDFVFAFLLGIVFQYFAVVPMRKLSPGAGIIDALKADPLSLIAWQVGMYGFMAFAQFYLLGALIGHRARSIRRSSG